MSNRQGPRRQIFTLLILLSLAISARAQPKPVCLGVLDPFEIIEFTYQMESISLDFYELSRESERLLQRKGPEITRTRQAIALNQKSDLKDSDTLRSVLHHLGQKSPTERFEFTELRTWTDIESALGSIFVPSPEVATNAFYALLAEMSERIFTHMTNHHIRIFHTATPSRHGMIALDTGWREIHTESGWQQVFNPAKTQALILETP